MQKCLNDFTRILQLLVLENAEIYCLILPILCQEIVIDLEEVFNFFEGSLDQILNSFMMILVKWVADEPLFAIQE